MLHCTRKIKVHINEILVLLRLYSCCWNYILVVEIIFWLMKIVEGMYIKGFKTLGKGKFFFLRTLDWNKFIVWMFSLTWLSECDQQVESPLSQTIGISEHHVKTNQSGAHHQVRPKSTGKNKNPRKVAHRVDQVSLVKSWFPH